MKTRLLFLFLILFASYGLQAVEISVTPITFESEYSSASDGDILLLGDGTYSSKSTISLPDGKVIIIKAAENASPVFSGMVIGTTEVNDGSLIFDGVNIDNGENYLVDGKFKNVKLLSFKNLTINQVGRCLIRSSNDDETGYFTIDNIEFENCIIKDCGANGWNFIYPKHTIKAVSVKNSTLYNYTNGESFFKPNRTNTDNVFSFVFENNTVYKWAKSSDRAICNVDKSYNENSTYVFRNNIINKPGVDGESPRILYTRNGGIVTAENNLVVDYAGGYVIQGTNTQTINDLTLEGLGLDNIGFIDPENGNFIISSTSPLATVGGGKCIGDPRWISKGTSIESTLKDAKDIKSQVYYNLQGNIINPANNNGFIIVKTTYTDGSISSEKMMNFSK